MEGLRGMQLTIYVVVVKTLVEFVLKQLGPYTEPSYKVSAGKAM